MASLKSLSDDELRSRLLVHGITTPVTAGTRQVLLKRLNHLLAASRKTGNKSSSLPKSSTSSLLDSLKTSSSSLPCSSVSKPSPKRSSTRLSLNTFSSDEEEEEREERPSVKGRRTRRESRGSVEAGNHRISRSHGLDEQNNSRVSTNGTTPGQQSRRTTRASPTYFAVSARSGISPRAKIHYDEYDTGSDSDPAEGEDSWVSEQAANTTTASRVSGDDDISQHSNDLRPTYTNHNSFTTRPFIPLDGLRNRKKTLENGSYDDRETVDSATSFSTIDGSPSRLSSESIVTQAPPNNYEPLRVANGRHHTEIIDPGEESTWHYLIPFALLVSCAVFFCCVGVMYVYMHGPLRSVPAMVMQALANISVPFLSLLRRDPPASRALPAPSVSVPPPTPTPQASSAGSAFPVCSPTLTSNCLTLEEVSSVQPLLGKLEEVLLPALHHHARLHNCGDSPHRYLAVAEIEDLLRQDDMKAADLSRGVQALGKLSTVYPNWGLEPVTGTDEGLLGLALSSQPTFVLCHITAAFYSFVYLLIGILTAAFAAYLVIYCVRYQKQKAEEERQQVFELVEQILEVLGGVGNGAAGTKDFVAVNHVRDSLISPRERREKKNLWDKAVNFIGQYESRVRREIQSVGGEDCEVWRWASGVPNSPGSSPGSDQGQGRPPAKVWQGQAFEIPQNLSKVTYTSCLKIRNMFDCDVEFGDNWWLRIQDSILEKCDGIGIVHVAVDRMSREGCVYLKCSSLGEAGRAFRALHGWWYDGNLVTVKFLREERYYQRFPSARHATCRLRPSNNKRLSLQAPAIPASQPSDHA